MLPLGEYKPLPSSDSARDLVHGVPGALPRVFIHAAGRAALIAVGVYAAGLRGRNLVAASIGGAVAIEIFALGWFAYQRPGKTNDVQA